MNNGTINETEVRKWFDIMRAGNELTEVRIIADKMTYSGYFNNAEDIISAIKPYVNYNIYFTINKVSDACAGRMQMGKIIQAPKNTTSDKEIEGRNFVFLDIDSRKIAGVNATDEEVEYTRAKTKKIYKFLLQQGFYNPIIVASGNGVNIFVPCKLAATAENDDLIKRFTLAMSMIFSDEHCEIDEKVFNRARIAKIWGTWSRKGNNTDKQRPQRSCASLFIPDEIKVNDIEYFRKVADLYPQHEDATRENNYHSSEQFDLDAFLSKHNITVSSVENVADGKKYILEHCVFDESHRGKDAVIFRNNNGAIAYYCFHNSCSGYHWKDVRLKFEPDAYSRRERGKFEYRQQYTQKITKETFKPLEETEDKGKKWLEMRDIKNLDLSQMTFIPTGYDMLDTRIMGLLLGEVTILSGIAGAGKTSWLDCVCLNAVQRGFKTAIWSGELVDSRFKNWMMQIAAGKNYVLPNHKYQDVYYAPQRIVEKICPWLDGKMFLYNNNYGNKWSQIFADVKRLVDEQDVRLFVLDNLMSVSIEDMDKDKYIRQTKFIYELKDYAKKKNIHVILVCHPRKQEGFLRIDSISGTADLTNLADNVFIIHRVNDDFVSRAGQFWGHGKAEIYKDYDCVLEICKNRSFGAIDYIVPMYYEKETRRLKNSISEHINYDWQEVGEQQTFESQDLPAMSDFPADDFPSADDII